MNLSVNTTRFAHKNLNTRFGRVLSNIQALAVVVTAAVMFQGADALAGPPGVVSSKFPALAPPPPGEYIPPASDEKASYYLMSKTQTPEGLVALTVRKSLSNSSYTKTLINCATHQFKVLGYSAVSAADTENKTPSSKWSDIVVGTSKYELVKMVCDK